MWHWTARISRSKNFACVRRRLYPNRPRKLKSARVSRRCFASKKNSFVPVHFTHGELGLRSFFTAYRYSLCSYCTVDHEHCVLSLYIIQYTYDTVVPQLKIWHLTAHPPANLSMKFIADKRTAAVTHTAVRLGVIPSTIKNTRRDQDEILSVSNVWNSPFWFLEMAPQYTGKQTRVEYLYIAPINRERPCTSDSHMHHH